LIKYSINVVNDLNGLTKIGEVALRIFTSNSITNNYLANSLYQIAKKAINLASG
jgi:hypothetical protein